MGWTGRTERADNPIEFDVLARSVWLARQCCGCGQAEAVARGHQGTFGWNAQALLDAAARLS